MEQDPAEQYTPPPKKHGAAWAIIILGLVASGALAGAGQALLGTILLVAAVGIAISINTR
jgi:hypothetical protein